IKNRSGGGRVHFLLPRIVHAALAKRLNSFPFIQLRTLLPFFCTSSKLNPFIFKQFRTLSQKHMGWGVPLLSVLLNRRSPPPIWRFKFFVFSQLSAFRYEPLAMHLAFSSRMYSIYAALAGWVQQQAASRFQDRHVHGRQQRKSTGNATERLPVPLRLQHRSQNHRPQLSLACAVQRFSRHGHVAAYAHPSGLAGSASPVPLQPRQFAGSLCRPHYASWFPDGFSGAHCRAPSRIRKLLSSAANWRARNGLPHAEPARVLGHSSFALW